MNWLDPEEVRKWLDVQGVVVGRDEVSIREAEAPAWEQAAVEFVKALASKYRTRHPGSCATRDGFTVCTCYIGAVELIAQRLESSNES